MPLVVSEKIAEKDYDPLFVINYKAFSEEPALLALFPGGLTSSARQENVAGFKASLGWEDPHVAAAKVVDDQTGQICAFATMRLYKENPFSGSKNAEVHLLHVDEKNRAHLEWLFSKKNDRRREIKELQVPGSYEYLQALCTDLACQREGAATLLLKWAVDKVQSKGSRAMLEASRVAVEYGLYEKYGFREVDEYTYINKEKFPEAEGVCLVTMVRDPEDR